MYIINYIYKPILVDTAGLSTPSHATLNSYYHNH